jgi:hypothetical protein
LRNIILPQGDTIVRVKSYLFILLFSIFSFPGNYSFAQAQKPQQKSQLNMPDSLNVRLIGRWAEGLCLAVNVAGNIGYFGNGSYLEIVDFSNPAHPTELGKLMLPATVMGIAVSGNYVYVANSFAGLRIIDVSNPSKPAEIAFYDTPGQALGLEINGTFVYLTDGDSGLRIIDISNPFQPNEIGVYDTNGQASKIAVSGNFAYVADKQGGMRVVDISNPYQPNEVGFYNTASDVMDVAISGNFAYVAARFGGLCVVDISNPYQPLEVGSLDKYGYAYGIAVRGTYAYLVDRQIGLGIIDISNPYQPDEVGYYDTDGSPHDVTLSGNYAFVANGHNGLRVIDISNPFQPNEIGFFNTDRTSRGVAVDSNYAYLAKWEAGLRILDISDPTKPNKIGSLNLNGWAEDVVVRGNYAYFTNYENGLRIIDISDPAQLDTIGSIIQNVNSKRVAIKENYAYVADTTFGLRIVDVSNPSQLVLIGSYESPGKRADAIAIKENYAYLAAGNDGLTIMDISEPSQPIQVGEYNPGGTAISIDLNRNYAYLGTLQSDFRIVDITNPAQPIEVGSRIMNNPLYEIVAKARYIYVANGESGLRVIDVIDPSNPIEAGYYVTGSEAYGITLDGNYVYLSCGNTGLYILEFLPVSLNKPPLAPILTSPVNYNFINTATPQFIWQIPSDENGDLLHFRLELDSDGDWGAVDYSIESKNTSTGFSPIPPVSSGSGNMSYTNQSLLSEDDWLWRVSAWDGLVYGEYSEIWTFIVDTTAPVLNSVTFKNPGYGENWFNPDQDTSVTLVISYDELYPRISTLSGGILPDTLYMMQLTGGYYQEVLFNFSIANQPDGAYSLVVTIQDSAENTGSKEGIIQFDSTPPSAYYTDAPDTIGEGQNYVVNVYGASDSIGCGVAHIYLDVFNDAVEVPTTGQDSIIGVTEPGIYFYRYFAEDYLGNRGEIKTDTTVVIPVYPQAPIFPITQSSEIKAGEDFWIDIQVGTEQEPVENLFSVDFVLNYSNTQYVDIVSNDSIVPGDLLGEEVILNSQLNDENGELSINITRYLGASGVDGYGALVRFKYASDPNTLDGTPIHFTISSVTANDSAGYSIELIPQDTTIWIIQPFSDFTMNVVPDSQAIYQGDRADFNVSFEPLGEFDSPITLEITELPDGMEAIYQSQLFDIPAAFTITFTASDSITPGIYHPVITATGGDITHSETVIITVVSITESDFSMTVDPDSQVIYPGESTEFNLSFQHIGEFDSQISLQISNLPEAMEAAYQSEPFPIPDSCDVVFSTATDIEPGIYKPIITATGGGIMHQVSVTIIVLQTPDFIMIIEPDSQSVTAGDSVTFYISFEPVGGFNAQIKVAVSDLPSGMATIFTSRPFNIPFSIKMTFTTLRNIPIEVYYPIVTAIGGGITHQKTVAINVLPGSPTIQGFSVQPNPFTPNNDGYNDYAEFLYTEAPPGMVIISIFDVSGRKITEIRNSRFWYGKDDKGKDVKPGAYIYIVKDGEKVVSKGVIAVAR